MEITCRQLIDFIADYVDGELDDAARVVFEHHLTICRSCRAYLETYRRTMSIVATMARDEPCTDLPEDLIRTILERAHS